MRAHEARRFPASLTALITPFRDGAIDREALERIVEDQIANGIDGLVPCGSTGESATLTHDEHVEVDRAGRRSCARGRVPVIAGTGSNSTAEAIRLTRGAKEAGADAALLISPYYNKPTQEGHLPALPAHRRGDPLPAHRLQHPRPHRLEDRGDDARAPGRARPTSSA